MTSDQALAIVQNDLALARKHLSEVIADSKFCDEQRRNERTQYACGKVDALSSIERTMRRLIEAKKEAV